jgi:hypothetical protein
MPAQAASRTAARNIVRCGTKACAAIIEPVLAASQFFDFPNHQFERHCLAAVGRCIQPFAPGVHGQKHIDIIVTAECPR